jgi:hypothetical protein
MSETPEQAARVEAEADPAVTYEDGRPKYHRHFLSADVHRDDQECHSPGRRVRVYVFDGPDLDAHEAFVTERTAAGTVLRMIDRLSHVM